MLKTLIRKQYMELFRTYFVNQKTGQPRSKGKVIGLFIGFGVLMLFSSAMFVLLALGLGSMLIDAGMDWLYFALMGMISILLGTFGSVFNTYAGLYRAKDNDLLISMPIPPSRILLARVSGVLGLSLLYSALVWIPAIVCYWIFAAPGAGVIIVDILLTFVIALFVSVLTCILGWLVALIAGKLKNRSFVTLAISLLFFGLYYFVCFKFSSFMETFMDHAESIGSKVKSWLNFIYQLGRAATGEPAGMLIFTGVTILLAVICYVVLSRSFIRIVTTKTSVAKPVYVEKTAKLSSVRKALLKRETKPFTSNPTYMLNCGLGIAFMLAVPVLLLINRGDVLPVLELGYGNLPFLKDYLPLALTAMISMMLSLDLISTPSISLEGKSLWIIRSLPADSYQVLESKVLLHFLVNEVPAVISAAATGIVLKLSVPGILITVALVSLINLFIGAMGLILGVKRPNLIWTSETQPIKQSTNILLMMLLGWVVTAAVAGLYFLVKNFMSGTVYGVIWIVLLALLDLFLMRWLKTGGVREFESL